MASAIPPNRSAAKIASLDLLPNSRQMGAVEIEAFLSHLAVDGDVAASTQNQALNAIVFLYQHVTRTFRPR